MEHSVSGYVLCVSMWFNTKFVRVPSFLIKMVAIYIAMIFFDANAKVSKSILCPKSGKKCSV